MGPIPFAFSVHHFINSVGADAGFAAIIGLAILVLLYFAQARETSALREQTYEWAQRVQQLEARIVQLTRQLQASQSPPAAPATAPPAARPVAGAVAGSTAVAAGTLAGAATGPPARSAVSVPALVGAPAGAPAGVAAPALTAATKLIPTGAPQPAAAADVEAPEQPLDLTQIESPPPATVAGGSNGHSTAEPVAAVPPPPTRAARSAPPRIQIRPGASAPAGQGAASRRPGPLRSQPSPPPSRGRRVLAALAVVVAVGVVVGVLLILTSGGTSKKKTSAGTSSSTTTSTQVAVKHKRKPQPASFNPANVTVAVLNGTATNQLAHRVALKLDAAGYKQGQTLTAADQTHQVTVVAYMPGHKRDAVKVAAALNLGPATVQPIDAATQGVVCPAGTPCTANVVVTAGSDLANIQ